MTHHLLKKGHVGPDVEGLRNIDRDAMSGFYTGRVFARALDEFLNAVSCEVHVDLLRVELRHLHGLGDKVIQAIALLIDDAEQLAPGGETDGVVEEKGGGGAFD